jgi:hypothetical protein
MYVDGDEDLSGSYHFHILFEYFDRDAKDERILAICWDILGPFIHTERNGTLLWWTHLFISIDLDVFKVNIRCKSDIV